MKRIINKQKSTKNLICELNGDKHKQNLSLSHIGKTYKKQKNDKN
jgi:hypothetical protein